MVMPGAPAGVGAAAVAPLTEQRVLPLLRAIWADWAMFSTTFGRSKPFSSQEMINWLSRRAKQVASDGDGWSAVAVADDATDEECRGLGVIQFRGTIGPEVSVWVADQYRRSGVGRQLILTLIDRARSKDLPYVHARILVDNQMSQAFFESLGFHPVDRPAGLASHWTVWRRAVRVT